MDCSSQELLDEVIWGLCDLNAQIPNELPLPSIIRQTIINCRLIQRGWNASRRLERLFATVLGDIPFVWHSHRIPKLGEISDEMWATEMEVLSICGMDLGLVELANTKLCSSETLHPDGIRLSGT
jgi:hypothetical protein